MNIFKDELLKAKLNKLKQKQEENEKKMKRLLKQQFISKEDFYKKLDEILLGLEKEIQDKLRSVAIQILDMGLTNLNRLPISISLEITENKPHTEYIKVEYYDSSSSILYIEGFKDNTFRYYDFEAFLTLENLEECFNSRQNLQLSKTIDNFKAAQDFNIEQCHETQKRWAKLHEFLNSLLGRDCDEENCITDDDELIEEFNERLKRINGNNLLLTF